MTRQGDPELLSIDAAAKRLGRSWRWTLDRVRAGELPAVQLNGRWYVRNLTAHLDALQAAQQRGTTAGHQAARSTRARTYEEECRALGVEVDPDFAPAGQDQWSP